MYKTIEIGGEDYRIKYGIEASFYGECTEKVINLMSAAGNQNDTLEVIKARIKEMSNIPQLVLSMFYAGLLEHHGLEEGDGKVPSKKEAKRLLVQYIKEHENDSQGNFYGVLEMLLEQMGEDGFFKLIGLEQMMQGTEADTETPKKVPQDHKKKQAKAN